MGSGAMQHLPIEKARRPGILPTTRLGWWAVTLCFPG
jgi:hypothetical protein